jgi:hypothetical protein
MEYNDVDCCAKGLSVKIRSIQLTTCSVAADGTSVGLEFLDQAGASVIVQLPFDQAEAVVMTLPHLLARALKLNTGNDEARYVFDLDEWSLESAKGHDCLIATLKTTNGFAVSFGVPLAACKGLGFSLQHEADKAVATMRAGERPAGSGGTKFN